MSETTDFYMSWLGCSGFGLGSTTKLTAPTPVVINKPTDISNCTYWFDATDDIAITSDASNNIISWANDGDLSGVSMLPYFGTAQTGQSTINGLNVVTFPVGSNMYFYGQLTSTETTTFAVYKNLIDLSGLASPYLNFINGEATAGLQTGVAKDPTLGYIYVLCQSGNWCNIGLGANDFNKAQYMTTRVATDRANNFISINGVNLTLTDNNSSAGMNTNPIPYSVGRTDGSSFDLGELIIFNRALTDEEIAQMYAYMATRWAIP